MSLLCFKGDIASVAVLIVENLEPGIIQSTDFLQRFRDGRATKSELNVNVWWGDGICSQPDGRQQSTRIAFNDRSQEIDECVDNLDPGLCAIDQDKAVGKERISGATF